MTGQQPESRRRFRHPNATGTGEQATRRTGRTGISSTTEPQSLRLTITERSDTDLERYPVVVGPVDIGSARPETVQIRNTNSGQTAATGVRQVDGGVEAAFKIWLGAGETTTDYVLEYGGDAASNQIPWEQARNNYHDGFEDGRLTGWETTEGEWRESGGTARPYGNPVRMHHDLAAPLDQTAIPIRWETRVVSRSTGGDTDQRKAHLRTDDEATRVFFMRTYQDGNDGVGGPIGWSSPDDRKLLTADEFAVGDWIYMRARLLPNGDIEAFARNQANGATGERTYGDQNAYRYTQLQLNDHGGNPGAEWEYVKLRYEVDPEPAVETSAGPPESTPTETEPATSPTGRTTEARLRDGDVTEVTVDGQTYYVITDFPNADEGQRAVTTPDYELVGTDEALDALWAVQYVGEARTGFYRGRMEDAREKRRYYGVRELLNRSSTIGLNLFVSYAMAQVNPLAGVPALVDALSETIAWADDEINHPYRETFTRQLNAANNMQWVDGHLENVDRVSEFNEPVMEVTDAAVSMWGKVDSGVDVLKALRIAAQGPAFYTKATLKMNGIAAGVAIGMASDYVEGWFRRNAVLSSAHHSYNTMRLSPLKTLLDLERRSATGGLAPGNIVRYHVYRMALAQMRAVTFDYSADIYDLMSDNAAANLITNASRRVETHRQIANGSRYKAATELMSLGASNTDARQHLDRSLNAEEFGGGDA